MAGKTITIDIEAYDRLKNAKKPNESLSQTIKRVVPKPFDWNVWLNKMGAVQFNPETVSAIEGHIAGRRSRSRRKG